MKRNVMALLLAACMLLSMTACGNAAALTADSTAPGSASVLEEPASAAEPSAQEETVPPEEAPAEEAPASEASLAENPAPEASAEPKPEASVAEASAEEEPEEPEAPAEPETVTVTFSDGQVFEATVGEDFVFFFQCDAPGDMGQPQEGEEGAGITTSDGTVTYSNVGLGGPY